MTVETLVDQLIRGGGVLTLKEGDEVRYRVPENVEHLVEELRPFKPELIEMLRRAGGRLAAFPHCPRCASYALYRENNLGDYECQTCHLENIEESTARRLM